MLSVERRDAVAWVWLDRPDKLNALNGEFWFGAPEVLAEVGDDPTVRAVVVAGRGKAFTVGIDLVEFGPKMAQGTGYEAGSGAASRRRQHEEIRAMQHAISAFADLPQPVIAAIHGYCIGAGVDLATACDIRLAAADASFSVRETPMAIVADVGTLQRLPRIVRPDVAADLVYTGRDVGAAEAEDIGLITRVLADAEALFGEAQAMAEQIAAHSPLVVQGAKRVMRESADRTVADGLEYVALWNAAFLQSADLAEAVTAYMEGRKPEFTGE